jgi:adenylate kinase
MKAIVLLGGPGAGKGTTAERVREQTPYIHVSTGDMLRAAVKAQTEAGKEAEGYMKRGELVPDELIIRLVEERLDQGSDGDCYMFDGFPRTEVQADLLGKTFERRGGEVQKVFLLDAPREVLIRRLTGRRVCRQCSMNFHIEGMKPKQEGVCDACGGELYHRPDDQRETIENRLDVYSEQTQGLIAYYEERGLLSRVDSNRDVGDLVKDVVGQLGLGDNG